MLGPIDERTPPMTPQLALRVAMIGGLALLLFAVIFFRLWFLQVLSGTKYVARAQSNVVQHVPVAAPRGEVVDSSGAALVESVKVPSIQIAPRSLRPDPVVLNGALKLPVAIPAKDYPLFDRLARLLGMPTKPHRCTYTVYWASGHPHTYTTRLATIPCRIAMSVAQTSLANVSIKTNVPAYVQGYIAEHVTQYPGVLWQDTYTRHYALGDAGAQIFGSLGQLSQAEEKVYKNVQAGDIVGQSGLEAQYNQYLQGINGSEGVKVDSQGRFEGYAKGTAPTPGDTLKISLNPQLEKTAQKSLDYSIQVNHGTSGAFVAMDPQNGQIYAMGSAPSYNPSSVSPTISRKELKFLDNPINNQPLINRAIDGPLPDGSTFKVITAVAALESGNWSLDGIFDDDAAFCMGTGPDPLCLHNSGDEHYGPVDLQEAIEVSDDEFFYNLGYKMNGNPLDYPGDFAKDWPLQYWASRFGIGHTTGVDLPDEANGEVGSPRLQTALWKQEQECENATGPYAYTNNTTGQISAIKLPGYTHSKKIADCAIATSKDWTVGDNVNTGVGQYDDQVTPLQLAVVYAAIENGGKIVTPHLATAIDSPTGAIVQKLDPAPKRNLHIDTAYLQAIQQGLEEAASAPGLGTSADVMGNFPLHVYGKTGTAELGDSAFSPEHAWYVCYVPRSETNKPLVVAVNVEKGGFGDVAAAPVARQILSQWFRGKPGPYVGGSAGGDQT